MKRVTGVGGIFFSAKDPAALRAWYKEHLGVDVQSWGGVTFEWADRRGQSAEGNDRVADRQGRWQALRTQQRRRSW